MMSVHVYRQMHLSPSSMDTSGQGNSFSDASFEAVPSSTTSPADNCDNDRGEEEPAELSDDLSELGQDLCGMCGLPQKNLWQHVTSGHGQTMAQYRLLYPKVFRDSKLLHR